MFDHRAYLASRDSVGYDRWLQTLHDSAAIIDVDLGRVLNRHGLADIDRSDPGTMFTTTDEEHILALVRTALARCTVTAAHPDRVEATYDAGHQVGLDERGDPLTGVLVVLDTLEMTDFSDWGNAWVRTARPARPSATRSAGGG